jgi:hypothetical protein
MGIRQSKTDVFVVMCTDLYDKNNAIATFSSLRKALDHVPKVCYNGPMWIEKFRVDTPGYYEMEDEFIVWRSDSKRSN